VAIVLSVVIAVAFVLLAGLVERGYVTRVWQRSSRLGRGRRYDADEGDG
jgi:hypothetical protein